MKNLKYFLILSIALIGSAASPLSALSDSVYQLSYSKTTSFPELEQQYAAIGLDVRQQTIETYKGIVVNIEDNSFIDPVELISFRINRRGEVSSHDNPTITGLYNKRTGELDWSGYLEHYGQLKYTLFSGSLEKIRRRDTARMNNSLVYHLDNNDGDELTASFQNGFLLLKLVNSNESPYEGWPVMVNPDGTFLSSLEIATEVITGQTDAPPVVQAVHNAEIVTEGRINSDGSIAISFYNDYSQNREGQIQPMTSYSGKIVNAQELSPGDENLYEDFSISLKNRRRSSFQDLDCPEWYINPPADENWWYASGSRSLSDESGALKMAETIAASVLASRIKVRIQSEYLDREDESGRLTQDKITQNAEETLAYEIVETLYDQAAERAYILIRMKKEI